MRCGIMQREEYEVSRMELSSCVQLSNRVFRFRCLMFSFVERRNELTLPIVCAHFRDELPCTLIDIVPSRFNLLHEQ